FSTTNTGALCRRENSQKRIGLAFDPDGGCGAMSRIYFHIVTQGEKLRFYTFDQRVEIPSGQVRTPDASLKKHIAPDQKPVLGRKKRQASRRMSRGEKTIQRRFPKADRFSFFQKKIGRR